MKAILVIDVPDDFETKTAIAIVDVKNEKGEGVTAMRPLKPMPNKKEENDDGTHFSWHSNDWWSAGWNECIDYIEKPETQSNLSTDEGWWRDYMLYEMQND